MPPLKGNRKPPNAGKGRVKGTKNKMSASTKAALTEAFDKLGGVPSLVKWGTANPGEFYKIWAKLVPQEHSGPDGGPIAHKVTGSIEWGGVKVPI